MDYTTMYTEKTSDDRVNISLLLYEEMQKRIKELSDELNKTRDDYHFVLSILDKFQISGDYISAIKPNTMDICFKDDNIDLVRKANISFDIDLNKLREE